MDTLLFSLPVFERPDILRGQIDNIHHFCPSAIICVAIAADVAGGRDAFLRVCDVENVTVNPEPYVWNPSGEILHAHVSNFLHVLERGLPFDKIVLTSSDEMLVKHGLEEFVSRHALGAQTEVFDLANDWSVFKPELLNAPAMQNFLSALGLPLFFGGQAEGAFFEKRIFSQLTQLFVAHFPMTPTGFPTEQIIPATVAARHFFAEANVALPVTLSTASTHLALSQDVIQQIVGGRGSIFAKRIPGALRSPHIGASVLKRVFSVKHIPREDCDLRRYVQSLMMREPA